MSLSFESTVLHYYDSFLMQEDARAREREAGRAEAAFVRETAERVAAEVCSAVIF